MTAMAAREAVLRSERSTATPPPLLGNFLPQNSVVHVDYVAHNVRGRELAVCARVHSRPHSPETLNAHSLQCFGSWGNRAPAAVPCIPVGRDSCSMFSGANRASETVHVWDSWVLRA